MELAIKEGAKRTARMIEILDTLFLARNDGTRPEAINAMADHLVENGYPVTEVLQAAKELTSFSKKFGRIGIPEIVEKIEEIKIRKINALRLPEPQYEPMPKEEIAELFRKACFGSLLEEAELKSKSSVINSQEKLEKRKNELKGQLKKIKEEYREQHKL